MILMQLYFGQKIILPFLIEFILGYKLNFLIVQITNVIKRYRKALDALVFDILGLTEEERKEIYWAVAALVKHRLKKGRSVCD